MRILDAVLEAAVGGVMLAAVLLNFANVVARYVFFRPIVSAEEILQYMNVWMVMLGAATITRGNQHLRMDVLPRLLPARIQRALDRLITGLTLALTGYVIVQAFRVIAILYGSGQQSVAAGIPVVLMYASIPLGFGCSLLFLVQNLRGPSNVRP